MANQEAQACTAHAPLPNSCSLSPDELIAEINNADSEGDRTYWRNRAVSLLTDARHGETPLQAYLRFVAEYNNLPVQDPPACCVMVAIQQSQRARKLVALLAHDDEQAKLGWLRHNFATE